MAGHSELGRPAPFRVEIREDAIADLRRRLAATRWPDPAPVEDWSQGVPLEYLRELCVYWADGYDHRRIARRLNAFPQFLAPANGLQIHFLHVRSPYPDAVPLLLTHGWPGSVLELIELIEPLVDPPSHGGDAADSFDVVCPSLPGYGFSEKPSEVGFGVSAIAAAWAELMAGLGYDRYGAHGGDWGSIVTMRLASLAPERLSGIHLTMPLVAPRAVKETEATTEEERQALQAYDEFRRWGTGYSAQQSTRPQTLGYGLTDSPAGQCAWIVEKLAAWSDCGGVLEGVIDRDTILDLVGIYWHTGTATSSARLYWESFGERDFSPIEVPSGCSIFPHEIFPMSRRWAETRLRDLRHFSRLDSGGHFPALERPAVLVEELREFFRLVR